MKSDVRAAARGQRTALAISLAAFGVPAAASFLAPDAVSAAGELLWILALIPPLLLAEQHGWRRVSVALVIAMVGLVVIVLTQAVLDVNPEGWPMILAIVAPYIALTLGTGWLSDNARERRITASIERSAAERMHLLTEAAFEAIMIHGDDGLIDANTRFCELFGYTIEDVRGLEALAILAPESRDSAEARMYQATRESFDAVCRRKDGTTFAAELRVRPLHVSGRTAWVTGVREVTALREAERTLRRLEKALDTMQLGVTMTDLTGRITYVNPADAALHGYSVEELLGRDISAYSRPGIRKALSAGELRTLSSWQRESTNSRKDGSVFPVMLRSDVIEAPDGTVLGVVTTCEDLTERKAAEEELRKMSGSLRQSRSDLMLFQEALIEAEKMESVGRLAAGVAHEVKNPLMTLLTGVKILAMRVTDPDDELAVLLVDMEDAVTRADTVIRGLLDFAAPRKLELVQNDLNAIVERSLSLMKHDLVKGQVDVRTELADGLPMLLLDPFKIQQVLLNLVTNALHATPAGGHLTVRTFFHDETKFGRVGPEDSGPRRRFKTPAVFVEIDDTGSGISASALTKIFDPFFTTKPPGQGTGLGLAVSRQIVQMHGGSMDIRNRPDGGVRATLAFSPTTEEHADGKVTDSVG